MNIQNTKLVEGKKIIKITVEINEIETKRRVEKINKTKMWFFEKINKQINLQLDSSRKKREKTQINKVRNNKKEVTPTPQKYTES